MCTNITVSCNIYVSNYYSIGLQQWLEVYLQWTENTLQNWENMMLVWISGAVKILKYHLE